jgi:hypothetical protein
LLRWTISSIPEFVWTKQVLGVLYEVNKRSFYVETTSVCDLGSATEPFDGFSWNLV